MIVLVFLIGLAIGSFLNSIIHRLEKRESIIKIRSYCPFCKKNLFWFELIPLMSFILQGGKCRKCKKPISLQYPLVELATGILFAFCAWYFLPNILLSVAHLLFISFLIIIFVYDLKHYIIPDEIIYPAIILGLVYIICSLFIIRDSFFYYNLFATLVASAFFLIIVLVSKGKWMGGGDVKLVFFMGLVLGWPDILIALFLAFLIGALVSIFLIIFKKKTLKSRIPFGPFLAGASVVVMFLGEVLISWYLDLFI